MLTDQRLNVFSFKKLAVITFITLLVSACGSGSKKTNNNTNSLVPVTPTHTEISATGATEIDAQVSQRLANLQRANFEMNNQKTNIISSEIDEDTVVFILKDRIGLITMSWDTKKQEPKGEATLFIGTTSGAIPLNIDDLAKPEILANLDVLKSGKVDVKESGDLFIISAMAVSLKTGLGFDFTLDIHEDLNGAGDTVIRVVDDVAYVSGSLGFRTYKQVKDLIANNPQIKRMVLGQISGSVDDDTNAYTARLVRQANIATHVAANSEIASGGVDLFAAGITRTAELGAKVGVHAWCCVEEKGADKLPRTSKEHFYQINYQQEMLGAPRGQYFYFFTIKAATHDKIHWMTKQELNRWLLTTPQK